MSQFKAFGTFYRINNHLCRKSAYLQFGQSSRSIGSTVMLNPGEARFMDNALEIDSREISGELIADPTMIRLAEILQQTGKNPLNGRFHIYNLFYLQNTSSKDAVKRKEWLQEAYINSLEIITQFREEQHPWVLLAWSTEKEAELQKLKIPWLLTIRETNIKVFGIKAKGKHMFYHPYPRIPSHRERYLERIIQQLKNCENIII
ncbi:hypothetical protein QMA04_00335 [Planococcus sp. APC 3900]|uniref:DUF1643 domain-containing protein n=1 Tax=Planococcus sp. APC 3900 TaxID=3035191 RepID=UPI0025B37792|nr:hypothetical protein [Planococcus sp. APC 3900]MDN3436512.1 hypothetical protein [Planococcus sp. APC 3900]